jgi:inner membrane protein
MDPLSHALLGAASAYAISSGRTRMTVLAGVGGALLPDIDVLIQSSTDPLLALEYHRHFTHSFVIAPLGALLIAIILKIAARKRSTLRELYRPALAGYLSALLLDACTSYGTQLLWPFSSERFAAGIVAVIDPVVTLILLVGVIMAIRRASPEPARIAIATMLIYLGFGALQHERAENMAQRTAAERGHMIASLEVKPTLGNLLLWRSVYLTGDEFVVDAVRVGLRRQPMLYPGAHAQKIEPIDLVPPLTLHSVQTRDVTRFSKVSEHYLARHPTRPNVIGDVRYSMLPDDIRPLWGIEIQPQREAHHVAFHTFRQFGPIERARFFAMLRGAAPDQLPALGPQRAPATGGQRP